MANNAMPTSWSSYSQQQQQQHQLPQQQQSGIPAPPYLTAEQQQQQFQPHQQHHPHHHQAYQQQHFQQQQHHHNHHHQHHPYDNPPPQSSSYQHPSYLSSSDYNDALPGPNEAAGGSTRTPSQPSSYPSYRTDVSSAEQQQHQQQQQRPTTSTAGEAQPSLPLSHEQSLQHQLLQQQQQDEQQQQQQRKRIAQSACELCRKKRTRCVVDPDNAYNLQYAETRGLACNSCLSQNMECIFSGVDRRKESVRELRARLAFLEGLFERLRSMENAVRQGEEGNAEDKIRQLQEQLNIIRASEPSQAAINMSISNGYVRGAGAPTQPGFNTAPSPSSLVNVNGRNLRTSGAFSMNSSSSIGNGNSGSASGDVKPTHEALLAALAQQGSSNTSGSSSTTATTATTKIDDATRPSGGGTGATATGPKRQNSKKRRNANSNDSTTARRRGTAAIGEDDLEDNSNSNEEDDNLSDDFQDLDQPADDSDLGHLSDNAAAGRRPPRPHAQLPSSPSKRGGSSSYHHHHHHHQRGASGSGSRINGDTVNHRRARGASHSDGSVTPPFDPNGVDDNFAADLAELVDRLAISNDGSIHAYGATSNLAFSSDHLSHNLSPGLTGPTSPENFAIVRAAPAHGARPKSAGRPRTGTTGASPGKAAVTPEQTPFHDGRLPSTLVASTVLPPGTTLETIKHLLHLYFLWHYTALPVISRSIFLDHLCKGGKYCTPLLLNAILAQASTLSDDPSIRSDPSDAYTAGDAYFKMARELLEAELEAPTIATVQALFLMAARELTFARDMRGWLYMGMCGRIALDLGLHLDVSHLVDRGFLTPEDQHVRSRTFWAVHLFDKELSAILGRPSAIRNIAISCPKPSTWPGEDFDWIASRQAGKIVPLPEDAPLSSSLMYLFSLVVACGEIFDSGVHLIYYRSSASKGSGRREHLQSLDKIMAQTRKLMSKLPPLVVRDEFAKDDGQPSDESKLIPAQIWLHVMHYSHIIMMNRPFYARSKRYAITSPRPTPPPPPQTASSGSGRSPDLEEIRDRCYEGAKEIVRLIGLFRKISGHGLQVTVNAMQHSLTNAATILILESSGPMTDASTTDLNRRRDAQRLLNDGAFRYLQEMSAFRPPAKRSLNNLKALVRDREQQERTRILEIARGGDKMRDVDSITAKGAASEAVDADPNQDKFSYGPMIHSMVPSGLPSYEDRAPSSLGAPLNTINVPHSPERLHTAASTGGHPGASYHSAGPMDTSAAPNFAALSYGAPPSVNPTPYMPYPSVPGSLDFYQGMATHMQAPPGRRSGEHTFYPTGWGESASYGSGGDHSAQGPQSSMPDSTFQNTPPSVAAQHSMMQSFGQHGDPATVAMQPGFPHGSTGQQYPTTPFDPYSQMSYGGFPATTANQNHQANNNHHHHHSSYPPFL